MERETRGWSQKKAAARLGVAQSYLSMLENGERQLTPSLRRKVARLYDLPTFLPLPGQPVKPADPQTLAEQFAALGYPGFAYLQGRHWRRNPAEVLLAALAQDDLEARLTETLPWLMFKYWKMDTAWLVHQAKLRDLQNRLGFVVTLARRVVERENLPNDPRVQALAELEQTLERSRLDHEDTFCKASLSPAERAWLRENRPEDALRWHLLTDWRLEALRYAR
jgi:transcriptional regulator with XRE-family HTH domain